MQVVVVVVILISFSTQFVANSENVYLRELTIYQSHETSIPFISNPPEVYLSCQDGLDSIDLDQVRKTKHLYVFETGSQPMTVLGEDGCVTCRLKEEDPVISDQTFGTWTMCKENFESTGNTTVEIEGQFTALFLCPDCEIVHLIEPLVSVPFEPPMEEIESFDSAPFEPLMEDVESFASAPAPMELSKELEETGVYEYYYSTNEDSNSQSTLNLQTSEEETPDESIDSGTGDDGISWWGIVLITISVLIVIIAIIVGVVFKKYPKLIVKISGLKRGAILGKIKTQIALTRMEKERL
eukprot:g4528.t1